MPKYANGGVVERRLKRARRQEGYSLEAAARVLEEAAKRARSLASKDSKPKPAPVGSAQRAQISAANRFAFTVVKEIETQMRAGMSLRGVAQWLNDIGWPTQKGGQWHPQTVANVLARTGHKPKVEQVSVTVEPSAPAAKTATVAKPATVEQGEAWEARLVEWCASYFPRNAASMAFSLNDSIQRVADGPNSRKWAKRADGAEWTEETMRPYFEKSQALRLSRGQHI